MDAGTLSIHHIFGQDRRHVVPLFQRPYVWERETQWEPLWEDIRSVADRLLQGNSVRPHFLGAIVLDQILRPTGHVESRWIIDGQQRLTTIQILLEAFADVCGAIGEDKYHKALRKLTRNDDPLSNEADEQYKVWPTNVDQEQFRAVMQASSPEQLARPTGGDRDGKKPPRIAGAYLFYHQAVSDWIAAEREGVPERVSALYEAIRENVRMVVIDLSRDDDAQLIFETLNARGSPLLPSDLVKNFVFHRASLAGEDVAKLYDRYWRPFDADERYWRHELGPGHARRARIDLFLQHYLTLMTRDEVPVGHMYQVYQAYARGQGEDGATTLLTSLHRYAGTYRVFDERGEEALYGVFFKRLDAMAVTTAYPFLLELLAKWGSEQDIVGQVLAEVESFLVRRMVCQLPTRGYNRLFLDLLSMLDGPADGLAARVRAALLGGKAESNRWPLDSEFRQAWLTVPAYRVMLRERVRTLLEALNEAMLDPLSEEVTIKGSLTIEHLMPQEWRAHWPLPEGKDPEKAGPEREVALHTIGNLTLLTKKLNPSVSNGAWETKREGIKKHSVIALNREVTDGSTWDENTIRERGGRLLELALRIWPRE